MDKVKQVINNLSLRKSIVIYIVIFLFIATFFSVAITSSCQMIEENISSSYLQSSERYYLTNERGERLGDGVLISTETISYSEQDKRTIHILDIVESLSVPLAFSSCMLMAVLLFYKTKLKIPLLILDKASERIAQHDLDFNIDYKTQDEMGRLCSSFDKMRFSLLQNNRLMQKQMEQRKRLNSAFAHDLRTPLTVLKGYTEILQLKSQGTVKETAVTMSKHINRLERYVDSMSSLQRMEDIAPDYKKLSLNELINHIKQTVTIIFEKSDKTFHFYHQIVSNTAILDVEIIFQVLENLVSNAIRYAKQNVEIELFEIGNTINIAISDDGMGFSAEGLENAVEPYYTGSNRNSEHFGLGLYICKLLCEHHGGSIEISNTDSGAKIIACFRKYSEQ